MPKTKTCDVQVKKPSFETVGDRYKRCTFLDEIQHIDIYGKLHRSYIENRHQKVWNKNDAAFSVTSVSLSPTRINDRHSDSDSSRNLDTEAKLSSFRVATRKSNLYPGQDNLSKKARKRWITCMKPTINANYEFSRFVPKL